MKINQVQIKNFHGIEEAEFELHDKTTVLLGMNAIGKSAVLDALAILAGGYFLGVDGVNSLTIKSHDIRQEIRVESDGSAQIIYHTPSVLSAAGVVHGQPIDWARDKLSLGGNTRSAGARQIEVLASAANKEIVDGKTVVRPFLGYYSVARLGAQKRETGKLKRSLADLRAGYINSLNKEGSLWIAELWFGGLQGRAGKGMGDASSIFEVAKNKVLSLFASLEKPLHDIYYETEFDALLVRFKGEAGFIPVSSLSSGYQSVLAVGLDIVYRMFVLNPHLGSKAFDETPGIALIDETDMHLHPKWQGRIIDDMCSSFPSLQFVFTTHSPFVVQGLRNARIIDMDTGRVRDVGGYVKKSIPEVAEEYMHMDNVERSSYFIEQVQVAEEYFTLLKVTPKDDDQKVSAAKAQLDEYEIRYGRDPIFIGLLRVERSVAGLE